MWLNQYICDSLISFNRRDCFKLVVRLWMLTYGFGSGLSFKVTHDQIEDLLFIAPFFPKLIFSFKKEVCRIKSIKRNTPINLSNNFKVYCWLLDVEYEQDMNKLLILRTDNRGIKQLNKIPNLLFYK